MLLSRALDRDAAEWHRLLWALWARGTGDRATEERTTMKERQEGIPISREHHECCLMHALNDQVRLDCVRYLAHDVSIQAISDEALVALVEIAEWKCTCPDSDGWPAEVNVR